MPPAPCPPPAPGIMQCAHSIRPHAHTIPSCHATACSQIVRTLAVLAHGDRQTSSMVASALLDVLRRARHGSNTIAHAVAYECVRAAASLTPPGAMLLGECAQVVSSLLRPSASPNLKYAGIQALVSDLLNL